MVNEQINPIVSVIVPVYNVAPLLQRCINSLIKQTLWDIEIILVDDGSTDTSPEICEKAAKADDRIRVVHKENGGLSSARNAGLDIAKGKYVSFIDSDDYVEVDMMQKMVEVLEKEDAQVSVCNVIKHIGKEDFPNCLNMYKETVSFENKSLLDFYDVYGTKLPVLGCNKLYCMDIISKYNLRFVDTQKILSEDQCFIACYFRFVKKAAFINESLYHYDIREGSLSRGKINCKIINQWINLVKEIIVFVDEFDPNCANRHTYNVILWNYLASACGHLKSKSNFILAMTLISPENMKFLKKTFFSVAFGKAGNIIAKKQRISFKSNIYFRFCAFLLWLGKYEIPAKNFFGMK